MSSDQNPTSDSSQSQPSMIAGHAKYVQGTVSSALGYESGEQTKNDAVKEMKGVQAQSADSPPAKSRVLGVVESAAGKVTGCEGMEAEGQQRLPHGAGAEEAGGTG